MSAATDKDLAILFSSKTPTNASKSPGWIGLALAGVTGGAAVILSVVAAPFVAPALRKVCLPYVPASDAQVNNVLAALKTLRAKSLIDLGSGDGRIVIAAVQQQLQYHRDQTSHDTLVPLHGTGAELNPWLVLWSRFSAWRSGVSARTKFLTADLWTLDLKRYDGVVIFGVQEMMAPLEQKLKVELPAEGAVIACRFPLPNSRPTATLGSGIDTVWLYRRESLHSSREAGQGGAADS